MVRRMMRMTRMMTTKKNTTMARMNKQICDVDTMCRRFMFVFSVILTYLTVISVSKQISTI